MNPLTIHTATAHDLDALAVMNKQLIEDEQGVSAVWTWHESI